MSVSLVRSASRQRAVRGGGERTRSTAIVALVGALAALIGYMSVHSPGLAVGMAAVIFALCLARRHLVSFPLVVAVAYLVLVLAPAIASLPLEVRFGSEPIALHNFMFPIVLLFSRRHIRRGLPTIAVGLFFVALVVMALNGLSAGAPLRSIAQQFRAPLMLVGGYAASSMVVARVGVAGLARIGVGLTLSTAALVVADLATPVALLGGRVGAAGDSITAGNAALATRFILGSEDLALVVLLLGFVASGDRRLRSKAPWRFIMLCSLFVMSQSLSRQLFVGLFVALLVSSLVRGRASRFRRGISYGGAAVASVLAIVAMASSSGMDLRGGTFGRQLEAFEVRVVGGFGRNTLDRDPGIDWRARENSAAVESVRRHPVVGVGFGRPYREAFDLESFGNADYFRRFVHNLYLHYAALGGLLGLAALLFVMGTAVTTAWREVRVRDRPDPSMLVCAMAFAAFLAMSFVDHVFVNSPTGAVSGALMAVLALHRATPDKRTDGVALVPKACGRMVADSSASW